MKNNSLLTNEDQKQLVLARFKTLNPELKISLGGSSGEFTVRDLIKHIEKEDELGKKIITVQMEMLKILSSGV